MNASFPIDVTLFGISIDDNLLQPLNASSPIDVTLDGISTEYNLRRSLNTPSPIFVTPFGILTIMASQSHHTTTPFSILKSVFSSMSSSLLFLHPKTHITAKHTAAITTDFLNVPVPLTLHSFPLYIRIIIYD